MTILIADMLITLLLCFLGRLITSNAQSAEDLGICALVASTNIEQVGNWSCSNMSIPISDPCRWYGVTCSTSTIRQIELINIALVGTLPDTLYELQNLYYLKIQGTSLYGSIPTTMDQGPPLVYLYLDFNSLTGSIPIELGLQSELKYRIWQYFKSIITC